MNRCVDYVRVVRPTYGDTESCGGNTIEDNQNRLEEGMFRCTLLFLIILYSWVIKHNIKAIMMAADESDVKFNFYVQAILI